MQNLLSSKVIQIDGKISVELPAKVAGTLNIKEGDTIEFGHSKHVEIWKSQQVIIPEEIVPLLRA
jgi:antitoxin component of MazEF toxin-antitoxin module